MTAVKWLQFILGAGFLLCGLGLFLIEVFGIYHFKYVLNRMHVAAIGDTLGIGFSLIGLIILNGFNMVSLKLFLIIVFLWISSPTSSHLIARLEVSTDTDPERHYRRIDISDVQGITEEGATVLQESASDIPGTVINAQSIQGETGETQGSASDTSGTADDPQCGNAEEEKDVREV